MSGSVGEDLADVQTEGQVVSPGGYSATVLEHFRNPRNVGTFDDADGVGRAENPASGASIFLYLRISNDRISKATFQAQGCTATIASASLVTEMVLNQGIDSVARISRRDIDRSLGGLPPTRRHAAALAEEAARAAVEDYLVRRSG